LLLVAISSVLGVAGWFYFLDFVFIELFDGALEFGIYGVIRFG
jgi:hypothetical protein